MIDIFVVMVEIICRFADGTIMADDGVVADLDIVIDYGVITDFDILADFNILTQSDILIIEHGMPPLDSSLKP